MDIGRIGRVGLAAIAILGAGCASIIKGGGAEVVSIRSVPPDASVKIIDAKSRHLMATGRTPLVVPLPKSAGYFSGASYLVVFEKSGYQRQQVPFKAGLSGWYVGGNLLFGGLIGYLIVDPATGAMWTLDRELSVDLKPTDDAPADAEPSVAAPAAGDLVAVLTVDELAARAPELLPRLRPLPPLAR
jgi:hypothetical protein